MAATSEAVMYGSGTVLASRYRLDERIGGGGMGEVWRATDQVLERTVAVKMMRRELVEEPGFAQRFLTEARTMAAIKHSGVVAIHDYRGDTSGAFLVMEYVEGEALSRRLQRFGRLDPARTMRLIAQAADALHAAHEKGVVHRDIKPGNLLVTASDTVVLTDFGIARSAGASQLTATGAVVGTPSYLAPEQVLGKAATARSDIYALGVVAYECLTGRRPFDGDNPFEVAMKRLREPPPTLAIEAPPAVLAVVEKTLAADPEQRWRSAAELAIAARQAAAPGAAPVTPPPPTPSPSVPASPAPAVPPSPAPAVPAPPGRGAGDVPQYAPARAAVPAPDTSPPPPPTALDQRSPAPAVSPPPVPPRPVSPPPISPRPVTPPPSPAPAPFPKPRRPLTVMVASVLLLAGAGALALYFGGVLLVIGDVVESFEWAANSPEQAEAVRAIGTGGTVATGTGLAISLILALLSLGVYFGKRAARVWALLLGFTALCCCGPPVAYDNFGDGLGTGQLDRTSQQQVTDRLDAVLPGWFGFLTGQVVLTGLAALLLALFMLNLPPATAYFRRPPIRPASPYPPYQYYPYYYGYPPRR